MFIYMQLRSSRLKISKIVDSQRKIIEVSNDMSDVFVTFLEMKFGTPYPTLIKWGEFMDKFEGCSLRNLIKNRASIGF